MTQQTLTPRATLDLILLALIWGGSFLAIRTALDAVPVATSVAWRVAPAAALLWAVVLARGLPVPRGAAVWVGFAGMGVLNNAVPFTAMAWAQLHIETGLTSILNATTAVFGVVLAALVYRDERLTLRRAAGVALGFAGVVAVIGPAALSALDLRSLAQGAVLLGTLSYAAAGLWARARLKGLAPEVAAAGMLTASALMAVPVALMLDGAPSLDLPGPVWASIGYYSVVATAGAYLLYFRVLAAAGAGNLLFVTLMIPPVAIALGAVVRDEALGPGAVLGLGLLAAGLMVLDGRVLRWVRRGAEASPPSS